ncbi:MAG: hypothetical protein QOF76_2993 [Solirubrobacteraceae bacterium]|nr:hypothetical protein [Solirubrobacteraceae bacterium]
MALDIAEQFTCEVVPDRERVSVVLRGELDLATAPLASKALDEVLPAGFAKVTIDLSGLTFIDSTGMRQLVAASRRAWEHGSEFSIIPGGPAVRRAFELTGLDTTLAFEVA